MLQTEEVDDDYFTPISSTSLANIFGNVAQSKQETENEKLKYTPTKPQIIQIQAVQAKATECLFACAVNGHEWSNNVYTSRGKLGFAIIKIQKSGDHNLILYDLNKTTLSCTAISPKFEISMENNSYISYYDNHQKYWSIYTAEDDAQKIVEILKKFDVIIKQSLNTMEQVGPPEPRQLERDVGIPSEINLESDTDSSINKKTKASILNRMANMGHSVLPTKTLTPDRSSDSSDTNATDSHSKVIRHKPVKNIVKRNMEHNSQPEHSSSSYHKRNIPITEQPADNTIHYSSQLVPTTNLITGFNCNSNNEMSIFMSEQRISNSELRINMSRITDKVDIILDKVNNFEHKGASVQTEILMKLLTEYENKIKVYEELLQKDNVDAITLRVPMKENEMEILRNTIHKLEQENKEKCQEILALQNEIQFLNMKYNEELMNFRKECDSLSSNPNKSNIGMEDKLKNIMNETFQTISVNFEKDEVYAGETVKKVIAAVIKKITIQSLSEL